MKSWRTSCTRNNCGTLAALAAAAVLAAAASMACGPVSVSPGDLLRVLAGQMEGTAQARIILLARLPRTCGCLLAGAALAVSGAVIQGVLQNPLAAPNVIGVNAGAGLAAALCSALLPRMPAAMPAAAFLGAFGGVLLVLFIARRTGASRLTLVLAGVAVSGMCSAGIDAVVTFVPEALNGYSDFRIGGLEHLTLSRIAPASLVIAAALVLALLLAGELDVLLLGDDTARSLGLPVRPMRLLLLADAAALAGAAVSFCGLLGFVGLIVPHMTRRLVGEESLPLLTASSLGGAALVTACDLLARTLFAPYELPVGIVLSLAGGPFFIHLLLRQRGGRVHD